MEDPTNSSSGVQPPTGRGGLAIDAADLLISDEAAWEMWPVTESAKTCGRVRNVGINTNTGNLWFVPVPCRTYGHRPCTEKLVKSFLRTIQMHLVENPSGFVIVMAEDDYEKDRLKHRFSDFRSSGRADRSDWYRAVKRTNGTVTVISTVRLVGRLEPVSMEEVEDLLGAAAEALRLPGVASFTGSRWPLLPDDDDGSVSHSFGRMFEDEREAFLVEVADEVYRRHGVRIDPGNPLMYPRRITMDEYIACAEAVKERTR